MGWGTFLKATHRGNLETADSQFLEKCQSARMPEDPADMAVTPR